VTVAIATVPGRGPTRPHPLLFVHGAWQAGSCWHDRFTPYFADRGWTCHTLDLRHHGASGGPRSLRRTRISDYVSDLAEVVERLDEPPVLVAHSMGGLISQRYLEQRDLPGCVLLAPVPLGGVWRATFRVARRHPLAFLKANLVMDLKPLVATPRLAGDLLFDPDIDGAEVEAHMTHLQGESYLAYLDMLLVTRSRPPLVHTPVAFVIGDRDALFSVKEITRSAGAYGVAPTVILGAGHQLMQGPRWKQSAQAIEAALGAFASPA
jgi:pimeloyl-ACP methyl ester carboxylesterase